MPADEVWKICIIEEIALIKKDHLEVHFDDNCLEEILEVLCTGYLGWVMMQQSILKAWPVCVCMYLNVLILSSEFGHCILWRH